jgi:glycosyltransferase involved in cell wall biosynthesis
VSSELIVAGLRASGEGYPNAEQTIRLLQEQGDCRIRDLGQALPPDLHLWKLSRLPPHRQLLALARLGLGNLLSLARVLRVATPQSRVYVPYPSVFFLWMLSFLPGSWRPYCIADVYISVWDSMFRDRASGGGDSAASRWIKRIEARALRAAARVLVDTEGNRSRLIEDFGLAAERVRSLPLAVDATPFRAVSAYMPLPGGLNVLFVGTLIPLHGVPTILDAVQRLLDAPAQRDRFRFRFIGDGQLGSRLNEFVQRNDPDKVSWVREWQPLDRVAQEIAGADICLGVFGGHGKASRVLPFKLYMYLASGRAVVSQTAISLPANVPLPPIESVALDDAGALADALIALADDPKRRTELAHAASGYFDSWLSGEAVVRAWKTLDV